MAVLISTNSNADQNNLYTIYAGEPNSGARVDEADFSHWGSCPAPYSDTQSTIETTAFTPQPPGGIDPQYLLECGGQFIPHVWGNGTENWVLTAAGTLTYSRNVTGSITSNPVLCNYPGGDYVYFITTEFDELGTRSEWDLRSGDFTYYDFSFIDQISSPYTKNLSTHYRTYEVGTTAVTADSVQGDYLCALLPTGQLRVVDLSRRGAVQGISADGVSRLSVEYTSTQSGALALTIEDSAQNPVTDGSFGTFAGSGILIGDDLGNFHFDETYTAPANFPLPDSTMPIDFTIVATQNGVRTTYSMRMYQPPVFTLHGVWSDGDVWRFFRGYLASRYPAAAIVPGDYKPYNYLSFEDRRIHGIVCNALQSSLGKLLDQGIVASQFDVVAHSMGGLVMYSLAADETCTNPVRADIPLVRKLIMVGTPVLGTPMANYLVTNRNSLPINPLLGIDLMLATLRVPTLANLMDLAGQPITCPISLTCAVDAFSELDGMTPVIDQSPIELSYGIKGAAPEYSAVELALDFLIKLFHPLDSVDHILDPSGLDGHDTAVPYGSESANANVQTLPVSGVVHTGTPADSVGERAAGDFTLGNWFGAKIQDQVNDVSETQSSQVFDDALCFLKSQGTPCSPAAPSNQRLSPLPPVSTQNPDVAELEALDLSGATQLPAETLVASPDETVALTPATSVSITFSSADAGFTPTKFYIASQGRPIYSVAAPSFSTSETPPVTGTYQIVLLAIDASNQYAVKRFQWSVPPPAGTPQLFVLPQSLSMQPGMLATVDSVRAVYDSYAESIRTPELVYSVTSGSACAVEPIGPAIRAVHIGDCMIKVEARDTSANIPVHVGYLDSVFGDGFE
jgi:pimeloyl-ACP methyl ester carboxylesterase